MLQWLLMAARSCSAEAGWQAADVVAGLTYATRSSLTMAHHPDGRLQLGPLPLGVQIIQAVRRRDGPAFPPFHPSVSLVHGPCIIVRHPVKTPGLGSLEQVSDALMQPALVLLHRQHVVGPARYDLLGDLPLAAHGVDGHDAAIQVQHLQQLWDGGDLIGLLLGLDLAQGQVILRGPGADQVYGPLVPRRIIGPSGRLAVNGHHLTRQQLGDGLGPGYEAILQLHWVQAGEHIAKGVVGWDTVGQFQEGLKPGQLALAEEFYVDPGIGAADGGTNGNGNDVHQLMASGAFHPWVVQVSEMIENSCFGWFCHAPLPPYGSTDHGTLAHF